MSRFLLFNLILLFSLRAGAQQVAPTMKVATDKEVYLHGDSIRWQCALNGFGKRFNAVTLQLWIEDLDNGMRWQYRFPVINSYSEGAIAIDKSIPAGQYAFNYILQGDFFNVIGHLSMPNDKDSVLNYLAIFKNKETILNTVKVSATGDFMLRGLVFQDTAMFTFSKIGKQQDPPFINIETSLDSTVTPVIPVITKFIHIVGPTNENNNVSVSTKDYKFSITNPKTHELETVVVQDRKINKQLKEYEEAYVSSTFKSIDDITLDGLSNDDMLRSGNLYLYLTMHVPGLTSSIDPETGVQEIKWRGSSPVMYVDEYRMPEGTPVTIMPSEVAMIKVYRPGNGPLTGGSSNSGAIAIYTKTGNFQGAVTAGKSHNRFYIKGYNALSLLWSY